VLLSSLLINFIRYLLDLFTLSFISYILPNYRGIHVNSCKLLLRNSCKVIVCLIDYIFSFFLSFFYFIFLLGGTGFKLRASPLLGRGSTTWTTPSVVQVSYFWHRVLLCAQDGLNCNPLSCISLNSWDDKHTLPCLAIGWDEVSWTFVWAGFELWSSRSLPSK
jgi:hypothetical protein